MRVFECEFLNAVLSLVLSGFVQGQYNIFSRFNLVLFILRIGGSMGADGENFSSALAVSLKRSPMS